MGLDLDEIDLLAIVGQTASGKSALGLKIARDLDGEIIAADSRTVYKDLDIGTAKPSPQEQKEIRHHLLDIVGQEQIFDVMQFQQLALAAIKDIQQRNKLPILVGGSGLYIDSILCNYVFLKNAVRKPQLRESLSKLSIAELQNCIRINHFNMPENSSNRRYLIRTLERNQKVNRKSSWREKTLVIGLKHDREILQTKIEVRLRNMLNQGLIEEIKEAWRKYPEDSEPLKGNIYISFRSYILGDISFEQACHDFIKRDLRLAKKQLTWFKRHQEIQWFNDLDRAYQFVVEQLKRYAKISTLP